MPDIKEIRNDKQIVCDIPIPIDVSFFHSKHSIKAHLVDHCNSGIRFISKQFFSQGTPIVYKIDYSSVDCNNNCGIEALSSINIGEISWCNELSTESPTAFKVGVKFYPRPY